MFKRNKNNKKERKSNSQTKKKSKLTKEEKQRLKEKRKKFKTKKKQFEIEGGIGGDKAPSTKRDVKTLYFFWIGTILCIGGIIAIVVGQNAWSNHLKNNTTELGKQLTFEQSNDASININEVWTDKNREVTVVKFGYPDESRKKLSTDGQDYKIHMVPKGKRPEVKISYGILDLEGDGYLFLKGKLNDQPYNMALENTLSLVSKSLTSSSSVSSSSSNNNETNIASVISSSNNDGSDTNIFDSGDDEKESKEDFVKFTINPYSESTKVYKGSFLNTSGEIDYSKVVGQTSIDAATKRKENEIEPHKDNLEKLQMSKPKYEEKVKKEKKAEAKKKKSSKDKDKDKEKTSQSNVSENENLLKETEESIDTEKEEINRLEAELNDIKEANYDKSSFGDMQNKATIY